MISFDKSFKSEIPLIREAKIKGTAINFNELIKIVPNGLIQFRTKVFPHSKFRKSNPNKTPKTIPIIICQCNANFFIFLFGYFLNKLINYIFEHLLFATL